jgi:hypothetical protein
MQHKKSKDDRLFSKQSLPVANRVIHQQLRLECVPSHNVKVSVRCVPYFYRYRPRSVRYMQKTTRFVSRSRSPLPVLHVVLHNYRPVLRHDQRTAEVSYVRPLFLSAVATHDMPTSLIGRLALLGEDPPCRTQVMRCQKTPKMMNINA